MNEELLKILQIRYVKLHFIVMFTEDSVLFPNKVSALRGGIGWKSSVIMYNTGFEKPTWI